MRVIGLTLRMGHQMVLGKTRSWSKDRVLILCLFFCLFLLKCHFEAFSIILLFFITFLSKHSLKRESGSSNLYLGWVLIVELQSHWKLAWQMTLGAGQGSFWGFPGRTPLFKGHCQAMVCHFDRRARVFWLGVSPELSAGALTPHNGVSVLRPVPKFEMRAFILCQRKKPQVSLREERECFWGKGLTVQRSHCIRSWFLHPKTQTGNGTGKMLP